MDKRKIELKKLQKKLVVLQNKYPNINLHDYSLLKAINEFYEIYTQAFHLEFEIEHCETCSQLLPQYKPKYKKNNQ